MNFCIVAIGEATATIELEADAVLHGNQQGTVHGGLLCELADAAIGTAHSTSMHAGESFTSIEHQSHVPAACLGSRLRADAWAEHRGKTISHNRCDIQSADGEVAARTGSVVMTLRGESAGSMNDLAATLTRDRRVPPARVSPHPAVARA